MINYSLKCEDGHSFDSWFQSASAFEALKAGGHLSCAVCGSGKVSKALMTPRVTAARDKATSVPEAKPELATPMAAVPQGNSVPDEMRAALEQVKAQVEANSDYVGDSFASEARAMHLGEVPERPIYGEARPQDAKSLVEDGIPVMPLPFMPTKRTN